jgi:hypothetical protein
LTPRRRKVATIERPLAESEKDASSEGALSCEIKLLGLTQCLGHEGLNPEWEVVNA